MKTYKWYGYPIGIGLVVLASLLYQLGHEFVSPVNMIMVYLLTVVVTAIFWGFGPSILVSVLSVLAFDFFFVSPFLTFTVDDTQYIFTFIVLLLVGIIISYLTSRIRLQTEAARQRERQTTALYALGKDLAVANNLTSYIRAITQRVKETFGYDAIILLPDAQNK
jgi:two-component system sensor histidine kinase KdpD